jgi:outer membrane scaffolding protein for murein synthesis (MipA/OmpV family)
MRYLSHTLTVLLSVGSLLIAPLLQAENERLWEGGIGLSTLSFPDYRGSKERQAYLIPFPYVVYRGDHLKIDRSGIRNVFFSSDRVRLDLSLNASLPVDSSENPLRVGMPDLDPTFEIGPRLSILLKEFENGGVLNFRLPVRAHITTEFKHEGWLANPELDLYLPGAVGRWNLGVKLGPLFADADFHNYYYSVDPQYATSTRPAFNADGGYSGMVLISSLSRRFDRFWVSGFVRYDQLSGTTFDDSPLVETDHSVMGGVAAAWIFARSKKRVGEDLEIQQ